MARESCCTKVSNLFCGFFKKIDRSHVAGDINLEQQPDAVQRVSVPQLGILWSSWDPRDVTAQNRQATHDELRTAKHQLQDRIDTCDAHLRRAAFFSSVALPVLPSIPNADTQYDWANGILNWGKTTALPALLAFSILLIGFRKTEAEKDLMKANRYRI